MVTTGEGLQRLAGPWEALRSRCPAATPFQSPAWLLPWWRAFGRGELRAIVLHEGPQLVGLVPLFVHERHRGGGRQILFVGTGNTDHLTPLAAPGVEEIVATRVMEAIGELSSGAIEVDLMQLPASAPLLRLRPPPGWRAEPLAGEPCPVLELSGREGLEQVVRPRFGARLRQARRRLERAGRVRVQSADESPEAAGELFGGLLRLHGASWRARGDPGVLADAAVRSFHADVIRTAAHFDVLEMLGLRVDDRLVAVYYGFRDAARAYYYLGGYEPAFGSYSVGTIMVGLAIEAALGRGAAELDFLRGQEAYKYRWGARDRATSRLRLTPGAASARAIS
jgi:CelD/BcsL family acetyltransferase involved in cellulose biosynthesis